MTAPDAPFPTTAAASPGDFGQAYEAAFAAGADAIVSITVSGDLSGTIKSATIGAQGCCPTGRSTSSTPGRASMAEGMLAQMGVEMAAAGASGRGDRRGPRGGRARHRPVRRARDARVPQERRPDQRRPGGDRARCSRSSRSSRSRTGVVETADRVRTRAKARERCIELSDERPIERLTVLHTTHADVEEFRGEAHRALRPGPGQGPDDDRRAVRRVRTSVRAASAPWRSTGPDRVARLRAPVRARPSSAARTPATRQGRRGDGLVAAR